MIHDKDYIIRIVKQFSEALSKLILNKNEGELPEQQRIFDTNMSDTFKISFDELSAKSVEEIAEMIEEKEVSHQIAYYELLGHLFYLKGNEKEDKKLLNASKRFYEIYLRESGIFSMPIMARIKELS